MIQTIKTTIINRIKENSNAEYVYIKDELHNQKFSIVIKNGAQDSISSLNFIKRELESLFDIKLELLTMDSMGYKNLIEVISKWRCIYLGDIEGRDHTAIGMELDNFNEETMEINYS